MKNIINEELIDINVNTGEITTGNGYLDTRLKYEGYIRSVTGNKDELTEKEKELINLLMKLNDIVLECAIDRSIQVLGRPKDIESITDEDVLKFKEIISQEIADNIEYSENKLKKEGVLFECNYDVNKMN